MLAPFWHNCPYFLHDFFEHRFCIDSVSFFHDFLDVQNHVFYCKTNSFVNFSLFQKSMNFHRFWHQFWYHFGSLLALLFDTFSASNFACLFSFLFYDFWSKTATKSDDRGVWQAPPGPPQKRSKSLISILIDFGSILVTMLVIF